MIALLRSIKKLVFSKVLTATFTKWRVESQDINTTATVMFIDGLIAIDSGAKLWINKFQADNYALLVKSQEELIKKYNLVSGDVFLGRDENYIIFRDGSISIKTDNLNMACASMNITVANAININEIPLTFIEGKVLINSKEIAVVGGDINIITSKITGSGQ